MAISRFFGGEIIRTPQSAEMYFTRKTISTILGVTEKTVERRLARLKYVSLKGLRYDQAYEGRKHFFKYGLDAILAMIFTTKVDDARRTERYAEIIDFITHHIGNLCFDRFTSLQGYHLDIPFRRRLIAHVCGVPYTEIVRDRIRSEAPYKGSMLRNTACTAELLHHPEAYLTREEVSVIKSMDLGIYLLAKHTPHTVEQIFDFCQITNMGDDYTDNERENLIAYIRENVL